MKTKVQSKLVLGLSVLLITIFFSCNKDDSDYIALSENINLELTLNSNSTVSLKWTLAKLDGFTTYRICRSKDINDYIQTSFYSQPDYVLYSSSDFYLDFYNDYNPYFLGVSYYWIEAVCKSENNIGSIVKSDLQTVSVSGIPSFNEFPSGVIFDKETNLLGLKFSNHFVMYNYQTNQVIKDLPLNSYYNTMPCFGRYNNRLEVYISDEDGVISIYDAQTMTFKDEIGIDLSYPFFSITTDNNGMLYASGRYSYYIHQINRATKSVSTYYNYDDIYLQYDSYSGAIFGLEPDSYPDFFKFSLTNKQITSSSSKYLSGYYYPVFKTDGSTGNLYILPNSKIYNTSTFGAVSSTLGYIQDIDFSGDKKYIAPFTQKYVTEISSDLSERNINLLGYPVYVFCDENKLITFIVENSVSTSAATNNTFYKGYSNSQTIGIQVVDL